MEKVLIELNQVGFCSITGMTKTRINMIIGLLRNQGVRTVHIKTKGKEILKKIHWRVYT